MRLVTPPSVTICLCCFFISIAFVMCKKDSTEETGTNGQNSLQFRGDLQHTGVARAKPFWNVDVKWTLKTGGAIRGSAAIENEVVYIGNADKKLYAVNKHDGNILWSFETGGAIPSTPAVAGDLVLFSSRDFYVYALNKKNGKLAWKFKTGELLPHKWGWEYFLSSPAVAEDAVIVGGGDGFIYCLSLDKGEVIWKYATNGRVRATAAIRKGVVFIGSFDAEFLALDIKSGDLLWKFKTDGTHFNSDESGWDRNSIDSSPSVTDTVVVFGSRDGNVYALNSQTGSLYWKFSYGPTWSISSPSIKDGTVYVGWSDNFIFSALDLATGKEKWTYECRNYVYSSPMVTDSLVYVGSHDRNLYAFNINTGEKVWQFRTQGSVFSSPVISDENIYVGSDDGVLYALKRSNEPVIHKAVYVQQTSRYWPVDLRLAPYLSSFGFENLDTATLEHFIDERLSDKKPSVIVFACDRVPEKYIKPDSGLLKQYLLSGGKMVWAGNIPNLYTFDSSDNITGEDPSTATSFLGLQYDIVHDWGYYPSSTTSLGKKWGLKDWWVGSFSIPEQAGIHVLATTEYGRPSAWVKSFGGPEGTGFVQIRPWEVGRAARDEELEIIKQVAEYGF